MGLHSGIEAAGQSMPLRPSPEHDMSAPLRMRLEAKRERLQQEIERVDGALSELDKNPGFEQTFDATLDALRSG